MEQTFPKPYIPLTPLLDYNHSGTSTDRSLPSILELPNKLFTTSGRTAIALLLEHEKIGKNDQVLIPAFHCEAMVAPAQWANATPTFYRINPDTSPDINDIKTKLTPNTKAIIVTHYFGFMQQLQAIRTLCDQHQIILIEDCAHALFGGDKECPIGTTGDYAIASTMKFLPIYEGGILASKHNKLSDIQISHPSLTFQLKSLINTVENTVAYQRLGILGKFINQIIKLKTAVWNQIKKSKHSYNPVKIGPASSEGGFGLDSDWVHKSCSLTTKLIIRLSNHNKSIQLRRQHYQKLHHALAALPNSHPLFEKLPENIVPFVYPLYVENPGHYFPKLKQQGVPIWRFGEYLDQEITSKDFPVSVDYSKHIFQFPCHQSLTEQELDWMINKITKTLSTHS